VNAYHHRECWENFYSAQKLNRMLKQRERELGPVYRALRYVQELLEERGQKTEVYRVPITICAGCTICAGWTNQKFMRTKAAKIVSAPVSSKLKSCLKQKSTKASLRRNIWKRKERNVRWAEESPSKKKLSGWGNSFQEFFGAERRPLFVAHNTTARAYRKAPVDLDVYVPRIVHCRWQSPTSRQMNGAISTLEAAWLYRSTLMSQRWAPLPVNVRVLTYQNFLREVLSHRTWNTACWFGAVARSAAHAAQHWRLSCDVVSRGAKKTCPGLNSLGSPRRFALTDSERGFSLLQRSMVK